MQTNYHRKIHKDGFIEKLHQSSFFRQLISDPELFLGIRNDYLNIYFMGASLAKIEFVKNDLRYIVNKKYCNKIEGSSKYIQYSEGDFILIFDSIKNEIRNFQTKSSKNEKMSQQLLILNNNSSQISQWFCLDMEYIQARENNRQVNHGRFDIIAISKNKPYQIALIELKYGCSAYSGISKKIVDPIKKQDANIITTNVKAGCGIVGHVINILRYFAESKKNNFIQLKLDIAGIIYSIKSLGLPCPIDDFNPSILIENPSFHIITIGENTLKARTQMKKYLLNSTASSKYCVENLIHMNIANENTMLNLHLAFSEDDGSKIQDIINDNNFHYGLE
ncbi:MAG: hypothetical protein ACYCYI_11725 [Saccharofermentanales bacterium]